MNLCAQKLGGEWIMKVAFSIEFQLLSIWMCRKHKTKMIRFHSWITSFNCARKCAAAVWTSIFTDFVLPCNWIFFISPSHDKTRLLVAVNFFHWRFSFWFYLVVYNSFFGYCRTEVLPSACISTKNILLKSTHERNNFLKMTFVRDC